MWLGTSVGTTTDEKGNFSLSKVLTTNQLVVRYVGFQKDTLTIDSKDNHIKIVLTSSQELQAVTVSSMDGVYISSKPILTQVITTEGLRRAACCNLSESFESTASVDVSYTDAVSGAKQIQMLGLAGIYSQMMLENTPYIRAMSIPFGLMYVPGAWMESISISKGTSSVINGYESITGQIDIGYKKPETSTEKLFLNMFLNSMLKTEVNANANFEVNEQAQTMLLAHVENQAIKLDHNHDGFTDVPLNTQVNVMNRWDYDVPQKMEGRIMASYLYDTRLGGQMAFKRGQTRDSTAYGLGVDNHKVNLIAKNGILLNGENESIGTIAAFTFNDYKAFYGFRDYKARQISAYANAFYENFLDKKTSKEKKEPVRKSLISKWKEKNIKEESNEPKPIENFLYLNKFFDKALENLNHEYIFSNLLTVIYLSELVDIADFKYIEQIQNILENNCENINKLKKSQLICEASLKILSKYYLGNKEKEDMIHTFLRGIPFYRGFFNCLISSLKQIKYIKFDNKFIQKESEKNLLSLIKENHSSKNIVTNYENEEQEELSTYNLYPFLELDFNSIDDNQNKILIKLLEDCISMLLKGENSITERDADEIFQSLINNFNIVLNFHGKNVYRDLFSSEKAITSEFFFIIWKLSNKEKKKALIMILKDYHKNLLRYHRYPFIYKFIQSIFSMEESKNQEDNQELIIDLFCFIVDQLEAIEKEKENTDDKKSLSYFVSNCVNLLILINNLIIKFDKLFENNLFYKGFFKLIIFIENTGILFSNYCFQINENIGKTIAEMCFDLLINLLNCSFSKELRDTFYNMFIIENRKDKEYLSIFYMTDLFREDLLMKEKLKAKFKNLVKNYDNLSYIQKNLFAKKKIYGKKPRQIIHINFSIYFLAKTFLYLDIVSDDLKNFFLNKFLIILSDNIYKLWTKRNSFYQHLICKHFPLYSYIKSFIEAHAVIQEPNINIYKKFFKELPEKLKNQAQVNNFNASRFFYEQDIEKENVEKEKNKEKKEWIMPSQNNFVNLPNINLDRMFKFEMLEKKNMIYNPKNYLMKIIFSSSFENIFFNDNLFKKIRASYLCKFRKNYSLNIKTKQLNYPTKQKNFSNSIEPKTFLRKDFNFYRKEFFSVSHEYIEEHLIKDEEKANLYFFPHNYYMDEIDNDINNLFECELITTQFLYFGQIKIGQKVFCFETKEDPRDKENFNPKKLDNKYFFSIKDNDNKTNKKKSIIIFIKDIKEILRRRNLLMKQAIEIFANNGKSFFFNFFKTENCEKVLHIFEDRKKELKKEKLFLLSNDNNAKYLSNILSQFKKGEISNYEYLLNLNKFSSRTYNDLTQYPIFPWLVLQIDDLYKITSVDSDIIEKENIRDMNYPVSMQEESKRIEEIIKYNEEDETIYRCHCGTHYSTSSYIFYYLMRTNPFGQNLIKLQNYKQENPNRMFLSFKETQKVLKSSTDNREMIPDLFCYVDYLCNVNCSFLGIRANSSLVDDFYINDVISNFDKNTNLITTYVECLYRQRKLLNDIFITKNLDKWVDIVFGKKQMPKNPLEAAKSCNTFSKYTYEQNINLENKLKKYQAKAQDKNMEKNPDIQEIIKIPFTNLILREKINSSKYDNYFNDEQSKIYFNKEKFKSENEPNNNFLLINKCETINQLPNRDINPNIKTSYKQVNRNLIIKSNANSLSDKNILNTKIEKISIGQQTLLQNDLIKNYKHKNKTKK